MKSQSPQRARSARHPPGPRPGAGKGGEAGAWERFKARLAEPVNGASLAVFRISVGIVMALEAWSLARPDAAAISSGKSPLETYYTGPEITFHFPFELFSWLPLFSPPVIYALVLIQGVAGVMMALGVFYRAAAAAVFLTWGYLWVVESTRTYWQSHYYLETLLTFLMIWMPAARRYSIDAWLARKRNRLNPGSVPFWTLFLLRGQLFIAYFYAGVAKLNGDWLLDAMPVRWFIAQPHVTGPYARLLSTVQMEAFKRFLQTPEVAYFLSYSGLIFDLAIGFLLLMRRTRIVGLMLMLLFHATNHLLIFDDIGWFPMVGILTALIFLDPDWPERFWRRVRRSAVADPRPGEGGVAAVAGERMARGAVVFVVGWLVWQVLMPIRHYFIPGDGRFTYEGLSVSWRLKSEVRRAYAVQLFVIDPNIISNGQIHWSEWHGDKVIYRTLTPGRIDWRSLPEIIAVGDPGGGERLVYNPYPTNVGREAEARQRATHIWNELYGRTPRMVRAPAKFPLILQTTTARTNSPAAEGDAPFLIIYDFPVAEEMTKGLPRISREHWKHSQYSRTPNRASRSVGAEPLVIHLASIGPEFRHLLPRECIFDTQDDPRRASYIWWNSFSDLTVSKLMHISYQAFYLRRYARRVAALWEAEYGRRPAVQASTAVSLNGRPHQMLVDPGADLGRVGARWLSHNAWIRQLETSRIPREAVENPPLL